MTPRGTLITDCRSLGGIGVAFVNAGVLTLLAIGLYHRSAAAIGGPAVACLFLVLGFGLFGERLVNVWFNVPDPVLIWTTGNNLLMASVLGGLFVAMAVGAFRLASDVLAKLGRILREGGQVPSGFVALAGAGPTLLNMSPAQSAGQLRGGLVLYNNGFAAGLVAAWWRRSWCRYSSRCCRPQRTALRRGKGGADRVRRGRAGEVSLPFVPDETLCRISRPFCAALRGAARDVVVNG